MSFADIARVERSTSRVSCPEVADSPAPTPAPAARRLLRARIVESASLWHTLLGMVDTAWHDLSFRVFRHARGVPPTAPRTLAYYFDAPVGGTPGLYEARCCGFAPLEKREIATLNPRASRQEMEIATHFSEYVAAWRRLKLDDRVFCLRSEQLSGLFASFSHVGFGCAAGIPASAEAELWRWVADGPGRCARELQREFWSRYTTERVEVALRRLLAAGHLVSSGQSLSVRGPAFPPRFVVPSTAGEEEGDGGAEAPAEGPLPQYDPSALMAPGVPFAKSYLVLVPTRESLSSSFWESYGRHERRTTQRVPAFSYDPLTLRRGPALRVATGSPMTYEELLRLGTAAEGEVDFVVLLLTPDVTAEHLALARAVARIRVIRALPLPSHCPALTAIGKR